VCRIPEHKSVSKRPVTVKVTVGRENPRGFLISEKLFENFIDSVAFFFSQKEQIKLKVIFSKGHKNFISKRCLTFSDFSKEA
jgi:hypothetical protein